MSKICGISYSSIIHLHNGESLHPLILTELARAGGMDLCTDYPGVLIQVRSNGEKGIEVIKYNAIQGTSTMVAQFEDSITEDNYKKIMELVKEPQ